VQSIDLTDVVQLSVVSVVDYTYLVSVMGS